MLCDFHQSIGIQPPASNNNHQTSRWQCHPHSTSTDPINWFRRKRLRRSNRNCCFAFQLVQQHLPKLIIRFGQVMRSTLPQQPAELKRSTVLFRYTLLAIEHSKCFLGQFLFFQIVALFVVHFCFPVVVVDLKLLPFKADLGTTSGSAWPVARSSQWETSGCCCSFLMAR